MTGKNTSILKPYLADNFADKIFSVLDLKKWADGKYLHKKALTNALGILTRQGLILKHGDILNQSGGSFINCYTIPDPDKLRVKYSSKKKINDVDLNPIKSALNNLEAAFIRIDMGKNVKLRGCAL